MSVWKPEGYPSVSPYLMCPEPEALIAFMVAVFGAGQVRRFDRPDGSLMHVEMRIDDSIVMVGGGATQFLSSDVHIHLYVPDAAAVYERASAHGAEAVLPPMRKTADDDLRSGFKDPAGNMWWVAAQ
jgi:PhnB protein